MPGWLPQAYIDASASLFQFERYNRDRDTHMHFCVFMCVRVYVYMTVLVYTHAIAA